jgi:hypothetical protein
MTKSKAPTFKIGDRVRLIPATLTWSAEIALQDKIGEVVECWDDGKITVRFANGRLLMGRDAALFELAEPGLNAKTK